MHDLAAMARALECSRRTLERWREDKTFPMPGKREKLDAWVVRVRAWESSRPRRNGRVFAPEAPAKQPGQDWVGQGQRALAMMRLHNLAVQRGEYLSKKQVHEEWRQRAFAVSRMLLGLPRKLAAHVPSALAELVEREAMVITRQALQEYTRDGESTPAAAVSDEAPA